MFGVESRKKMLGELVWIENLGLNFASLRLNLDVNSHGDRRLTDLELSGAAQLPTRVADRRRPTRPLERLVRPQGNHAQKASTKPTERRCTPKSELGAKDRVAGVNAGGPQSPVRVRTPGTVPGARVAAEGKEPPAATKPQLLDANRKKS